MPTSRAFALSLVLFAGGAGAQDFQLPSSRPDLLTNQLWTGPVPIGPEAQKTLSAALDAAEGIPRLRSIDEAMSYLDVVERALHDTRAHSARQRKHSHKVFHRPKWLGVGIGL